MGFLNPREAAARGWEGAKNVEGEKYPLIDEEKEVLKMAKKEPRPEIQDFTDVYPQEEVSADKQWLEQQRTREVEVAKTSRGKILETIIRRQAELSNWLGDNCHTVATTEYDDRANHVDFVVEWEKPDGQICRLAVDITTTEDPGIVNKKEELIEEEIERGTLTTVKYFESEADQTKGKIEQLPRVVLAVDRQSIQKLCKDLVREKPKELAKSPEQLLLLKEIRLQMVDQIEYAFALLLENLDQQFKFFSPEEKQELRKLAKSGISKLTKILKKS